MKKKTFTLLSVLLIISLILVGCGGTAAPTKPTTTSGSTDAQKEQPKKVYKVKLGHSNPGIETNIIQASSLKFAELAKQYTNGQVEVEIYPANQLGDEVNLMRSMQTGAQEMVYGSVQNFGTFSPSLNYLSLPYIFTSEKEATTALDKLWDKNTEWLVTQGNMRPLAWAIAGFRNLTTDAKHPVRTLADAKGVKVRIPPNKVSDAAFKAFGLEPVSLAFSEVFAALQQGVVSGQENCNVTIRSEHYDETQKYVTDIQWMYTIGIFAISEKIFKDMPKDVQEGLIKAGKEATKFEWEKAAKADADDINYLKGKGMQFLGTPTDYDKWIEKGRSIWPSQYGLIGGGDAAKGKAIVDDVLKAMK